MHPCVAYKKKLYKNITIYLGYSILTMLKGIIFYYFNDKMFKHLTLKYLQNLFSFKQFRLFNSVYL